MTVKTVKTEQLISIPVHPLLQSIFSKYLEHGGECLPRIPSNQKMNDYLKELCLKAGIEDKVEKVITMGGVRKEIDFKKYQLVSTHTARRSFATNLYLQGFPAISIMKITGHNTEKAFLRYLKISQQRNANDLQDFWACKKIQDHKNDENGGARKYAI